MGQSGHYHFGITSHWYGTKSSNDPCRVWQSHLKTPHGVECFRSTESGIRTLTNLHSASNSFKAARRFKCHVKQRRHKAYPRRQDESQKSNGCVTDDHSATKLFIQRLPTPLVPTPRWATGWERRNGNILNSWRRTIATSAEDSSMTVGIQL